MLIVECGEQHRAEREYAIDVLLGSSLGLEYRCVTTERPEVVIRDEHGRRLIVADELFAQTAKLVDPGSTPSVPLATCPQAAFPGALLLGELPVVYGRELSGGGYVAEGSGTIELGLDVFGTAFALLTCLSEVVATERDAHGRVPAAASLPVRAGFAERPLVDEYTEILWWAISRLWPSLQRVRHTFSIRPTHDVDWPFYSRGRLVETLRDSFARRELARERLRALVAIKRRGRDADPCNTFGFLTAASESRGLTSAFYVMGGGRNRDHDPGYPLDDAWLVAALRSIADRGHELGVHPSYETYRDVDALRQELSHVQSVLDRAGIEQQVRGGRQHYLRFEHPTTWANWESVGLAYDSTLGYAELAGFRCGTARPFQVFDVAARRALALVERPLLVMEAALLSHQSLSLEAAAEEFRRVREVTRQFDGTFTFLWHNNKLATAAERAAYCSVLD